MSSLEIILSVVVALHVVITFALIVRMRALQEMVSGPAGPSLPAPGTAVGAFAVTTVAGEVVTEAVLRDDTMLVGFFSPDCPWCEKMRADLVAAPPALPMLAFVRGGEDNAEARALRAAFEPFARVAYTADDDVASQAFQPAGFPSLFLVKNGMIAAAGHARADVAA
jgi:thiol-disulfide isomerase/thioredoxin